MYSFSPVRKSPFCIFLTQSVLWVLLQVRAESPAKLPLSLNCNWVFDPPAVPPAPPVESMEMSFPGRVRVTVELTESVTSPVYSDQSHA